MRSLIRCVLLSVMLCTCAVWGVAQKIGGSQQMEQSVTGGVVTLYALDPITQSFCFRDATAGHIFQQHEVKNRCSDINYNSYYAEHLAVGIEGGRLATIVDLGTTDDLTKEYGYEETIGGGQGFASVHFADGKVLILKDRRARVMQDLKESRELFAKPTPAAKASVKLGHVYLARITDRNDTGSEILVKLMVIGYLPGESVTFRWQLL